MAWGEAHPQIPLMAYLSKNLYKGHWSNIFPLLATLHQAIPPAPGSPALASAATNTTIHQSTGSLGDTHSAVVTAEIPVGMDDNVPDWLRGGLELLWDISQWGGVSEFQVAVTAWVRAARAASFRSSVRAYILIQSICGC